MRLQQIKCPFASRAKGIVTSQKYVIFLTGRRAIIADKKLNILKEIENLFYVYRGSVSPDETKLLLISSGMVFYIVDLNDFSTKRYLVRGKYATNLEGLGCWSFDSNGVYIVVDKLDRKPTELRLYTLDVSENKTIVKLFDQYMPCYMKPVKSLGKYLFIFYERGDYISNTIFVWFDGQNFTEYLVEDGHVDDVIASVDVLEDEQAIIINGYISNGKYDYTGKRLDYISTDSNINGIYCGEAIQTIKYSADKKYIYVGTSRQLLVINCETGEEKSKPVEYDLSQIEELDDHIILATMDYSTKVYKVIE